jgi:hypothetical protein
MKKLFHIWLVISMMPGWLIGAAAPKPVENSLSFWEFLFSSSEAILARVDAQVAQDRSAREEALKKADAQKQQQALVAAPQQNQALQSLAASPPVQHDDEDCVVAGPDALRVLSPGAGLRPDDAALAGLPRQRRAPVLAQNNGSKEGDSDDEAPSKGLASQSWLKAVAR